MNLAALALIAASILSQSAAPPSKPSATPPKSGPQEVPGPIRAEPAVVEFGIVEPGSVVASTIKLVNPLDRPVTIRAAKPSCTCTTVDMTGKVIPAKGSIEMPMSMKTAHSPGKKAAQVNLVFEGINQLLAVRLEAETAYAVRANPVYIDALAPERMTGFFELLSGDGRPFMVKSVDGKPAQTADGAEMKPATRQVVKYDLTKPGLHPSVPPFLIVETDHPKCPVIDLRVRHSSTRITPLLNIAEFRSSVGVIRNGTAFDFEIEVKNAGQVRVARAVPGRKEATAVIVEQRPEGESLMVKIRMIAEGMPSGPFLFPCTLEAPGKNTDLWIFGTVQ